MVSTRYVLSFQELFLLKKTEKTISKNLYASLLHKIKLEFWFIYDGLRVDLKAKM